MFDTKLLNNEWNHTQGKINKILLDFDIQIDHPIPTINQQEGARGVMVIVVGNGHGDTSSNPQRD